MEVIKAVRRLVVCDIDAVKKIIEVAQKRGETNTKKNGSKEIKCESGNIEVNIVSDYDKKREAINVSIVITNMITIVGITSSITRDKQNKINYGVFSGGFSDDDVAASMLHNMSFDDFESMMKRSGYTKLNNVTFGEIFLT